MSRGRHGRCIRLLSAKGVKDANRIPSCRDRQTSADENYSISMRCHGQRSAREYIRPCLTHQILPDHLHTNASSTIRPGNVGEPRRPRLSDNVARPEMSSVRYSFQHAVTCSVSRRRSPPGARVRKSGCPHSAAREDAV